MNIFVSDEIKKLTPNFFVGILEIDVVIEKNTLLDNRINEVEKEIFNNIDIKDVVQLPIIIDGRNAYKTYGKDPSRYRLATESLYRRLAKGNKLYRINNVVDTGNLLSLLTRKSVAVLDYSKIKGDILIRLGKAEDEYFGIGRGKINVENIPLYEDNVGPFGSVTSDTERTMVTNDTTKILVFIISFSGEKELPRDIELAEKLFGQYCKGTLNIKTYK